MPDYENPYYYALLNGGLYNQEYDDSQILRGNMQRYLPGRHDDAPFMSIRRGNPYSYSTVQTQTTPLNPVGVPMDKPYKQNMLNAYSGNKDRIFFPWRPRNKASKPQQTAQQSTEQEVNDSRYNANVALNTAKSALKNAPLVDSVLGYYQTKRDTPDYSDIENAKNFALRPTNVYTYSPTHITGNMKFNPYDYTEQANKIQAQSANAINLASRQGRGNTNLLMAHINNLMNNTNNASGDAYMKSWKANEQQRIAVAQENRRADEYNANADNTAAQSYTQARNLAATQDKTNGYNALNNYATQKYGRQQAYQQRLAAARDEMISNLGTYGENAYNANEANTDQSYNYWKDAFGRLHYNGGKPYDYKLALDNDIWQSVYDNASDDEKAKLNGMTRQQRRNYIVDKLYKANA